MSQIKQLAADPRFKIDVDLFFPATTIYPPASTDTLRAAGRRLNNSSSKVYVQSILFNFLLPAFNELSTDLDRAAVSGNPLWRSVAALQVLLPRDLS